MPSRDSVLLRPSEKNEASRGQRGGGRGEKRVEGWKEGSRVVRNWRGKGAYRGRK